MEGKKLRGLRENCQAVSEIVGQLLMIAIVVLAFSSIAVLTFTNIAVNPPHIPHTDFSEKTNTDDDTIIILHNGGEAIDLKAIKIILFVNGVQNVFNLPGLNNPDPRIEIRHLDGSSSADSTLMLGDFIVLHTNPETVSNQTKIDMSSTDLIEMFIVHTPSKQVIQKVTLQNGK